MLLCCSAWFTAEDESYRVSSLHVEYARRRIKYGILFIFSLLYEYSNLEYVHIHVIYMVKQAKTLFVFLWLRPRNT